MRKKIIICGLIVAILATYIGFFNRTNASEVCVINSSLSETSVEPGNTFSLTVSVSGIQEGIAAVSFILNYDESKLEVLDYTCGELWRYEDVLENSYSLVTKSYEATTEDGDIITINFKAKEGIESTTTTISLEYIDAVKDDYTLEEFENQTQNIEIIELDKVPPTVSVDYSNTRKTNKTVVVTITADEEIQEVEGWTLSTDKKSLTKSYSQNTTEEITVKDIAGNETKQNIVITNIGLKGDFNDDDSIGMQDILILLRNIAYERSSTIASKHPDWILMDRKRNLADTNNNGKIDTGDVLVIQRYLAASSSQKIADKHPDWLNLNN